MYRLHRLYKVLSFPRNFAVSAERAKYKFRKSSKVIRPKLEIISFLVTWTLAIFRAAFSRGSGLHYQAKRNLVELELQHGGPQQGGPHVFVFSMQSFLYILQGYPPLTAMLRF